MKNKNFDSVFGNSDRGYQKLIESQANTESKLDARGKETKVKQIVKTKDVTRNVRVKKGIIKK